MRSSDFPASQGLSRPRHRGIRLLVAVTLGILLGAFVTVVEPQVTPAQAADNTSFDPGYIISDEVFFNKSTMSAAAIKAFFAAKDPGCTSTSTLTCLIDFTMATTSRPANENCGAYAGKTESAASIIYRVSQLCGINPQVLLVTLQKEQSFITGGPRSAGIYRKAMGYGCPDSSVCNSQYYGFYNQVYKAAWQLRQYGHSSSFKYKWGASFTIDYHPTDSCGGTSVYIRNEATAALYNYTPYQPNAAALTAGSGIGNSCSSYGNRNFWRFFTDWFGNPANLLPGGSFDSSSVSGWMKVGGDSVIAHVKNDPRAQSGPSFISTTAAEAGRSIVKNISRSIVVGQSFTSTIWVRSAVDEANYQGQLVLRTLGGTPERATQAFDVGSEWQEVTVSLDILESSHTGLRIQIDESTPGQTLFIDTASIATRRAPTRVDPVALTAPSFELGSKKNWLQNSGGKVSLASTAASEDHPAQDGDYYLSASTMDPTGSIAQTVARSSAIGESYTLTAWVRAASPTHTFRGKLAIAALGGSNESAYMPFVAGAEWTKLSTTLAITKPGHTKLKAAIYLYTGHRALEIDNVSMVPNLLSNPSFEASASSGWFESTGTGRYSTAIVTDPLGQIDGVDYLQITRTVSSTTRFSSDIWRRVAPGESYTFGGWFRSSSPDTAYTSQIRLIGRGGVEEAEIALLPVVVGQEWTYFETTLVLTTQQQTLRAEIGVSSMPFALEVDGLFVRANPTS